MREWWPIDFEQPVWLGIAVALFAATIVVARFRGLKFTTIARICLTIGLLLIAVAAGEPRLTSPGDGDLVVMVDMSPSTRTADFRDHAKLLARVKQLVGNRPHRTIVFGSTNSLITDTDELREQSTEQTTFQPPDAGAIVLFSDGQFELPRHAPPVFAVIDPQLEQPVDAAVTAIDASTKSVRVSVKLHGASRDLHWFGTDQTATTCVSGDAQLQSTATADEVGARFSAGDAWPENDAMSTMIVPPTKLARWWASANRPAPADWQSVSPANLPGDLQSILRYLNVGVMVLDNVPADALSSQQQHGLEQYVREFGGALLIIGGDHAFGAGGYSNTPIDSVSPLASSPSEPRQHWYFLIDASGSMSESSTNQTSRWTTELAALRRQLLRVSPADRVSVGCFSDAVRWWTTDRSAAEVLSQTLPPTNVEPNGPTNLKLAIDSAAQAQSALPAQWFFLTDAEAPAFDVAVDADALVRQKAKVNVLALSAGDAAASLQQLAKQTGGVFATEADATRWITAADALMKSSLPDAVRREPIMITFSGGLKLWGTRIIAESNQVWLRSGATQLNDGSNAMAAIWQAGLGQCAAVAFAVDADAIDSFANSLAREPADSRYTIHLQNGSHTALEIDAMDHGQFINNLHIVAKLSRLGGPSTSEVSLLQIAPGRYLAELPCDVEPRVVDVSMDGKSIKRLAVAGRYAAEFDAIGNNRDRLAQLAASTGGKVIEPDDAGPIVLPRTGNRRDITAWLGTLGSLLVLSGLVLWKHQR